VPTLRNSNHPTIQKIVLQVVVLAGLCVLLGRTPAQAQTFNVLYNFTGGSDGGNAISSLAIDASGNLFGTAFTGGIGYGTDFELSPSASGWTFSTVYSFKGFSAHDGGGPSGLFLGPKDELFGTTQGGGGGCRKSVPEYEGCGIVYEIGPAPARAERVLYRFTGGADGNAPYGLGPLALHGNSFYSTTFQGGTDGDCIYGYQCGVSFQLTPSSSGIPPWTETVTQDFGAGSGAGGAELGSSVIFDAAGNMYGTALAGGSSVGCHMQAYGGCGVVYELSPSGSGWTETVLYNFTGGDDGGTPYGGLIFDSAGNLYGTTAYGGTGGGGTVYELSPSSSGWTLTVLAGFLGKGSFPNGQCFACTGSVANLIMDASGNLYGTTIADGAFGDGMAFELSPSISGWTFTDLHDFSGGSDGGVVWSGLTLDTIGNLYGATWGGGASGVGVVYEITP
jgi:uncharacterized repeat protein (TIGR03803 family)